MLAKAECKYLRITPTKVRLVLDLIRNKDVIEARNILVAINKRSKEFLLKILNSAIANAKVKGFQPEQLYVSRAICDQGTAWKRFKAGPFGRALPIRKRTSHIKIELDLKNN